MRVFCRFPFGFLLFSRDPLRVVHDEACAMMHVLVRWEI